MATTSFGQENPEGNESAINFIDTEHTDFGVQAGTFLPFGIVGVRDQYPSWGAWYSQQTGYGGLDWGANAINAKGVKFYNGYLSLRVDFKAYDFIDAFFRLGFDAHNYKRKRTILRTFDFFQTHGGHVGFGGYIPVGGALWLRSDFKFGFGPGNQMFVNLGLVWRWNSSEKDK